MSVNRHFGGNMYFSFKIDEVEPLLDHTEAAKKHRSLYGGENTAKPGLLLVKDDGVYVMSNGHPGLLREPEKADSSHRVVYAIGFPSDSHLAGDDFAEFLEGTWVREIIVKARQQNSTTFSVLLTENEIELRV